MQASSPPVAYDIKSITYTVPSATTDGHYYQVSIDHETQRATCDCPASQGSKTRGKCWHIKAVRSGLAGKPRIRIGVA